MNKVIIIFLLFTVQVFAATYYVDSNAGPGGNGSQANPWDQISDATASVSAGDIVRVLGGIYTENLTESTSGSNGNQIIYVAYSGTVTIRGTWIITGNYIIIVGFTFDGQNSRNDGIYLQNADYCEVWNCKFYNYERDALRTDSGGNNYESNNCIFVGNYFYRSGLKDYQVRGDDNIVAYSESDSSEQDFLYLFGQRNYVLNNYSHDIDASPSSHTDFVQSGGDPLGMGYTLIEGNLYLDTGGSDHHGTNVQANVNALDDYTISRNNVWHGHGSYCYGYSGSTFDYKKFYNETVASCQVYYPSYSYAMYNSSGTYSGYHNIIWYQAWGASVSTATVYDEVVTGHSSDNNIYYDTGGNINYSGTINNEANSLRNVDPEFNNYNNNDFTIAATSQCRGAGGYLTRINDSPGSGTTFTVDDASYFRGDNPNVSQYGGSLIVGDKITVGNDQLSIAAISGNNITVTSSFTWADNDPIYWGWDTTPDIGALPYRSNGYNLTATYVEDGNVYTVTPNEVDLVRWVEFYENGIPMMIDNSSPFQYTSSGGTVTMKVRPYYASTTLSVTPVPGSGGGNPSQPSGIDVTP